MAQSNTLSKLFGKFARCAFIPPVQRLINFVYVRLFKIDLNGFAPLKLPHPKRPLHKSPSNPRPIDPNPATLIAPCDGIITACGAIEHNLALQIKGMSYRVNELLGKGEKLDNYSYFNFYLSPKDYHRFHASCDLEVIEVRHFCGELLPVNTPALKKHQKLFIRNERVVVVAKNLQGQVLYFVAVGALNVGQIVLNFDPLIRTNAQIRSKPKIYTYDPPIALQKGEELGRFEMGSTIVLFVPNVALNTSVGQKVLFSTPIGVLHA
ncbi:Phosphatidylserine decarboxylase Psd [Helicobacter sp. NHP19-003]|uniref:phosphatidylserine decarboxylase n=1 Tax=Helicobacter gastrocanis TaxID=2849641 RepID=A0ABN6I491_9HELI|nr:phosphatidylserine decarboxylase [Helicobacter sp. NHP19-003]BCZ16993.1 Phosphatidylserine decarboxylase Psd [Helicobacter sp. NHP19-003]